MGYRQGNFDGKQDMLEQLRAKRRKRKARLLAFSILATAVLVILLFLVLSIRSCVRGNPSERIEISQLPADAATNASEQSGEISFRPAPLFSSLGTEHLLTALAAESSSDLPEGTAGNLVAYRISDGQKAWERPVNDLISGVIVSGGNALVLREDNLGFSARAFSLTDGSPVWDFDLEAAQDVSTAFDDNRLAVAYLLADGYRVAIYDTVKGVKSSGIMLQGAEGPIMDFSRMNMRFVGAQLLYTVDRNVGMIDIEKNRHWTEQGSAPVLLASPDPDNRQVYVLSLGNGSNSLVLHVRDFADGRGKELDRFETAADSLVMVADRGSLLLAYSDQRPDGHYETSVRLFQKDSKESYVRQTLSGARVEDAMPISSGLFIMGTNRSTGDENRPLRGSNLHLVNAEDGSVTEFESMRDSLEYTIRFGEDRLVLMDGGEIRRIELAESRTVRVRRAANPVLEPMFSPAFDSLAVLSFPREDTPGESSSRMQALIFR